MKQISVSLGLAALPKVQEAVAHAAVYPSHDPVIFFAVTDDAQTVRWVCDTCSATTALEPETYDPVNHPSYYTRHPSGVECITITEWFNFNRGNAIKYIWRAGDKSNELEDLEKARWYLDREIQRLKGMT